MSEAHDLDLLHPQTDLRPPETIMRLSRMGASFPTRLSFLRSLLRDLAAQKASLHRDARDWDTEGFGHATYRIALDGRDLTLITWTAPLEESNRTDRVIATAWDACFVLFHGVPTASDIASLGHHASVQEAGRYDPRILVVSRANKSVRLFDYVADALAAGHQPDPKRLADTGYLMRTTAVYGNGKFGMADRDAGSRPFRLEMLAVYLIREFTLDLVEHVAKARNAGAAKLSDVSKRVLGIGNSTGLGMAPFLVSHPVLLNNWILVRETALARVRALPATNKHEEFVALCKRATRHLAEWNVDDPTEQARIEALRAEWAAFDKSLPTNHPWDHLVRRAETGSESLQELVTALVLEPHGDLIDGLADCMGANDDGRIDPRQSIVDLKAIIRSHYGWATGMDLRRPEARAKAWYVSEEKLEPRLGEAVTVPQEHRRMPHDIPHRVQALAADLQAVDDKETVGVFLASNMAHRAIVNRVQTIARHPYGEIRDNLVAEDVRPIDLLRCKLAFFGAARFDPRSDLWTRIVLYQGAPCADELTTDNADDGFLPAFGTA